MGKKGKKKKVKQLVLKSNQCYILVADDIRTLFFWQGANSSIRSKFIGLQKCQSLQDQLNYRIVPQDEGHEDPNF